MMTGDTMTPQTTTLQAIRRLAIIRQGLHQRPAHSSRETLLEIIRRTGLLQLDSVSVTARSHYLVMLSRAGLYDPAELDMLLADGHLFEYWAHAACMIPIEHYPYFEPWIRHKRETRTHFYRDMGSNPAETVEWVMKEIREQGALSSKEFESQRDGESGWWNWKPAKMALEYLFDHGYLMISHRVNFHRYYQLTEHVLEKHDFKLDYTLDDWQRWATMAGLRQQGSGTVADIADYYRLGKRTAEQNIMEMVRSGEVLPLQVEDMKTPMYIHRDDWPLLQEVEAGQHMPQVTTFLSPFDNLIWYRPRVEALFGFYYRIELYTPAPKRKYGYYVLPILHRDQLVGRIDPKIERKSRCFRIHALHLEPGTEVNDDLTAGMAAAVREFAAFHGCDTVEIDKSDDEDLKAAILQAV